MSLICNKELTSKVFDCVCNGCHTSSLGGEVVRDEVNAFGSGGLALIGDGLQVIEVPRDQGKLAAEGCEVNRRSSTDAGTSAGYQHNFSFQSRHFIFS